MPIREDLRHYYDGEEWSLVIRPRILARSQTRNVIIERALAFGNPQFGVADTVEFLGRWVPSGVPACEQCGKPDRARILAVNRAAESDIPGEGDRPVMVPCQYWRLTNRLDGRVATPPWRATMQFYGTDGCVAVPAPLPDIPRPVPGCAGVRAPIGWQGLEMAAAYQLVATGRTALPGITGKRAQLLLAALESGLWPGWCWHAERQTLYLPDKSWMPRLVTVVLSVCHLDHDPANMADWNLRALCQFCHLIYDLEAHASTRKDRKDGARPILRQMLQVIEGGRDA